MSTELPSPTDLPSQWLNRAAEQWPEELLISGPESLTYQEVQQRVNALAAWAQEQGIQKGDRIVLVIPNRIETVLLTLAGLQQGIIFTVLNNQTQPEGLARILSQCEPKALFLDNSTAHLTETAGAVPVVSVDSDEWNRILSHHTEQLVSAEIQGDDIAFLVFTSGSTGTPRGVILTHSNVGFVSPAIMQRLRYQAGDRIGIFLPLAFDYSLYQIFYACMSGACLFIGKPEMVGPELPKIIAREEITVLPGVPTLIAALIKMQRYRPTALPHLRMITNTGDHLPRAYVEQIHKLLPQVQVFPMFGLTECKRVSILLPEEIAAHPDSVGRPLDGTLVFAVDEEGRPLPSGTPGELAIQGPHVTQGYWRAPEETAKRFRPIDGVLTLFSGDQGSVDAEGYITFHSRSDFVIKHRGTRLSPAEVEEAACSIPQILTAGCIKDDQKDRLVLFITTNEESLNEAQVLAALAERLEMGKVPDRVIFVAELPRTGNQKLDRKALRNLLTQL